MSMSQQDRPAVLQTPLGTDVLNAVRFEGVEGISEDFEYRVEAVGEKRLIDLDALIGTSCTLTVHNKAGTPRPFNGYVSEANWLGEENDAYLYELVLRPKFWLLTRKSDCRLFHEMSAPDIIQSVLGEWGINAAQKLSESYPVREYCVQYCESDHDFVARLMEHEGIYYFFEHSDGDHVMVLADAKSSHRAVANAARLKFSPWTQNVPMEEDRIFSTALKRHLRSGKYGLGDYNYLKPNTQMITSHQFRGAYSESKHELFDYPGDYAERFDGDRLAQVRVEAEQALDQQRQATGDTPLLYPGGLTTLEDHPEGAQNIEYLVLRVRHSFHDQTYRSGGAGGGEVLYRGVYDFLPSERPFRAARQTPRPRVLGPQTAKVTGNGEIDVDEHGRILLKFFWDREEKQSRRVRVAQTWSGKAWGSVVIPRVGQEVVVEYLEGDPDRPLVIGTVYNAENTVPYPLPGEKTKSGVKSESTTGGGGYNEIMLDDKKDAELIGVHAQKDLDVEVLNAETRTIGEKLEGDKGRTTTLKKGDDDLVIEQGDNNVTLKTGDQNITLEAGSQTTDVGRDVTITAQSSITLDAGMKITLKVGSTKIEMTPAGITIKAPGSVDVNGGGMMKLKAGMININ